MSEKLGFTPHILEVLGDLDSEFLRGNITDAIKNYYQMEPCPQRPRS